MLALLQRVSRASVEVGGETIAAIDDGILVFVGFEADDDESVCERALERIVSYRVFEDDTQRMNLSVKERRGDILFVPQFTLAADTRKGNRASFSSALPPDVAAVLFEQFVAHARASDLTQGLKIECGQFGADMNVNLINRGPVTFLLTINASPT